MAVPNKRHFPHSFVCAMIAVFAFAASIVPGVEIGSLIAENTAGTLGIERILPYAGCDLAPEYCVRAASLCVPTLVYLALIWLCAYVRFEKPLLALLFAMRGITLGAAVRLCVLLSAPGTVFLALGIHALITLILLTLVFRIRTSCGLLGAADSLTAMMITGGLCCTAIILTTLIP